MERVAKAPQRPAAWFYHGTAVHLAIEEYEKMHRLPTVEEAQRIAVNEYDRLVAEALEKEPDFSQWLTGGNKRGEKDVEDRRVVVAQQVETYIGFAEAHSEEWRILDLGGNPAVEVEFRVDFGGVEVLGYIDQIRHYRDGRIAPIDIKTGSRKQDSSFQLAIYAHAINANLGVLPISGAFWEAKHGADNEWLLNQWSKELLGDMFYRFDQAEKQALYVPNPGDSCRVCSVKDYCRVNGVPALAGEYADKFVRAPRAS